MTFLVKFSCFFVCSGISSYNLCIHLLICCALCLIHHFSIFVAIFSLNELEGRSLNLTFLLIMVTLFMLLILFFLEIAVSSIVPHFLFSVLELKSWVTRHFLPLFHSMIDLILVSSSRRVVIFWDLYCSLVGDQYTFYFLQVISWVACFNPSV